MSQYRLLLTLLALSSGCQLVTRTGGTVTPEPRSTSPEPRPTASEPRSNDSSRPEQISGAEQRRRTEEKQAAQRAKQDEEKRERDAQQAKKQDQRVLDRARELCPFKDEPAALCFEFRTTLARADPPRPKQTILIEDCFNQAYRNVVQKSRPSFEMLTDDAAELYTLGDTSRFAAGCYAAMTQVAGDGWKRDADARKAAYDFRQNVGTLVLNQFSAKCGVGARPQTVVGSDAFTYTLLLAGNAKKKGVFHKATDPAGDVVTVFCDGRVHIKSKTGGSSTTMPKTEAARSEEFKLDRCIERCDDTHPKCRGVNAVQDRTCHAACEAQCSGK